MTTAHTPTPWRLEPPHASCDDVIANVVGTSDVITSSYPANFSNAAHIVKCVNMHDELVEALKWLHIAALQSTVNDTSNDYGCDALGLAYTALKKAGAL